MTHGPALSNTQAKTECEQKSKKQAPARAQTADARTTSVQNQVGPGSEGNVIADRWRPVIGKSVWY